MTTAPTTPPQLPKEGCFVQFTGTNWPAKAALLHVVFGHRVLNMPLRQSVLTARHVELGLLFAVCLGAAHLGHLGLTLSLAPKGMSKRGFYV